MNDVILSSTEADSVAVEAIRQHHAELLAALDARVHALGRAAGGAAAADRGQFDGARADLLDWCRRVLLPHARGEEKTLYADGHAKPELRLLIDGMLDEHVRLSGLIDEFSFGTEAVPSLLAAGALRSMLAAHVAKENELMLPALAAAADVSVADGLQRMHSALSADAAASDPVRADAHHHADAYHDVDGHTCSCHESDAAGLPELDARTVPHAIRHSTIFGALDAVRPGGGLVLVAPHDPLPLLAQLEQRAPGMFAVDYLQRGPQAWRLAITRRAA